MEQPGECLVFGPAERFRDVSWKPHMAWRVPWAGAGDGGALVCAVGLRPGAWELGCALCMKQELELELEQQPGNQGLLMGTWLLCWKAHGSFVCIGDSLSQELQ